MCSPQDSHSYCISQSIWQMPSYVPRHDRPPKYASLPTPPRDGRPQSPRYASPDVDPNVAYPWTREGLAMSAAHRSYPGTDEEGYTEYQEGQDPYGSTEGADRGEDDERAQRSWPREEAEAGPSRKRPREEDHSENGHGQGRGHPPPSNPPLPGGPHHGGGIRPDMPIIPSIFGIAPRNPFTRTVGEFIMNHARGRDNVEVSG
jgi:polynucleotide 5'-triphosphatase